jgi:hypothetical protein
LHLDITLITTGSGIQFWALRPFKLIGRFPTEEWNESRLRQERDRRDRQATKLVQFFERHHLLETAGATFNYNTISNNLKFWARLKSWTYCPDFKLLSKLNLLPSYHNKESV